MSISSFKGSNLARTRSRVGVATRVGSPEDVAEARREHAEAKIATYIERVVNEAPPLTREQKERLAALLAGGDRHVA